MSNPLGPVASNLIIDAGPSGLTLTGDGTTNGGAFILGNKSSPQNWNVRQGRPPRPVLAIIPIASYDQTNSNEKYSFYLQEAPDAATWTTVSRTAVVGGTAPTDVIATSGGTLLIGFMHAAAYVRLVKVLAGTSPTITFGPAYLWDDGEGAADQYQ
jgi:hypothetical protein